MNWDVSKNRIFDKRFLPDDWDLQKYRIRHEEELAATETERLAQLQLGQSAAGEAPTDEGSSESNEENIVRD